MLVRLDLRKLERVVVAVAVALRLTTLAFACIGALRLTPKLFAMIPTISEGQGSTFSMWVLCITLALSSALLLAVAIGNLREGAPFARHWLGLSGAIFVAMLDAFTEMHDMLDWPILGGWARDMSWTVPVSLLVVIFAGAYVPFLRHRPRRDRSRLVLAGTVYLFGAIVLEALLNVRAAAGGSETIGYTLLAWMQGTLELTGSSILLLSAAAIFDRSVGRVRVELA